MSGLNELVQYVMQLPLTWLFLTLVVFQLCITLQRRCQNNPLLNPTIGSVMVLIPLLLWSHTSYSQYFSGVQWLHWLLGPATVALAIPLYQHLNRLRSALLPLAITLCIGSFIAVFTGVVLGWLLGLPTEMLVALAPRSVTTPIAMGIAEHAGGSASLAAVFVMITGLLGAVVVLPLLRLFGLEHPVVLGYATGLAAHGLGTARVFALSGMAGAFAALAMGLNGALTAIWLPLCLTWFGHD